MKNTSNDTNQPTVKSYDEPVNQGTFAQNTAHFNTVANTSVNSPSIHGQKSISGSTPDLESDDDVLRNAHKMGIGINADFENPKELNLAQDVADAEKFRRNK